MNEDLKPAMKGVWIPIEILFDERLSPTEKVLFSEIDWLDNPEYGGCFMSNERFSKLLGIKVRQVQQCISNLKKYGFIKQSSFNGRQRILNSLFKYCIMDIKGHVPNSRGAENCMSDIQETAPLFHIRENIKEEEVGESSFTSKKTTPAPDLSKYHYLSELLITKIKLSGTQMKIIPGKLIPKWANDFRLMVEQDKKTEKQIEKVIEAIFADEFWCKVIRSAGSLREKWKLGKLDGLKDSQNAQEAQGPTKALTPWQELCRDSGDPAQRVLTKLLNIWEKLEGKAWQNYDYCQKLTSFRDKEMQSIFEIMREFSGRSNVEMIEAVKKHLERVNNEY